MSALQSMTGYGRSSRRSALGAVTVELRSVNHRYLEIEHRLPNGLSALQGRVTELLRERLKRGRIETNVVVQLDRAEQRKVTFDEDLLARYHEALLALKQRFGVKGQITLEHLLALPQARSVSEEAVPVETLWPLVREAARAAVEELVRARQREGRRLATDLRRQLQLIERHVRTIKRRLPQALGEQRRALRKRLRELLGPGTSGSTTQLEQAAALVREADVHEELVRLESHLSYMRQTLAEGPLVGKRLDFIAQELMREINTLGAKVNDPQATHDVVDIKGCIEKIREQVQNLE